jgi:precorrin-3B synthase
MTGVSPAIQARPVGRDDRCPGVLRPHLAADGAMIRVRVPGGQTTGTALARLARIGKTYGSGLLQLTSRASVQLRGLPEVVPDAMIAEVASAGFLPSTAHERVRNIVASPLTGLVGGLVDLRPMVTALDQALCASPELADLPGRFLFVLDDGRGDVLGLGLDLGYRALAADHGLLLVGGDDHGRPVAATDAVRELLELARHFLGRADVTGAWHVRELPTPLIGGLLPYPVPAPPPAPIGKLGPHACVSVPLGLLTPDQVQLIEQCCPGPLVITPGRGLILPDAAESLPELVAAGLVADAGSGWTMISACVGAPWCANGRADTRALAADLVQLGSPIPRTHLSGCERRCGAPVGEHVDLVAPTRRDLLTLAEAGVRA